MANYLPTRALDSSEKTKISHLFVFEVIDHTTTNVATTQTAIAKHATMSSDGTPTNTETSQVSYLLNNEAPDPNLRLFDQH